MDTRKTIVVRPEVAARLKKFCAERGLKLQFAAEQAVAEWLRRQTSEEKKLGRKNLLSSNASPHTQR